MTSKHLRSSPLFFPFKLKPKISRRISQNIKLRRNRENGIDTIAILGIKSIKIKPFRAYLKLRNTFFNSNAEYFEAATIALAEKKGLNYEEISRSIKGELDVNWVNFVEGKEFTPNNALQSPDLAQDEAKK